MPRYIVSSEGPIHVRPIERPEFPVDPDYGIEGPAFPGQPLPPHLPPRDEWPELPPWFQPGVGLPIPPTPDHPIVPLPPPRPPVEFPDLSGKTLALARIYVSRHVNFLTWIVVDNEEIMEKAKAALEKLKDKLPAGGVGGRPPQTRPPG